jgi:hypothetical protein
MRSRQIGEYIHLAAISLAVGLLALLAPLTGGQTKTFDKVAWLRDYQDLKSALERSYSNLAWFASPQANIDLPALNQRTLSALHRAKNDEDATTAILAFVAAFHDGHFSRLVDLEPALVVKPALLPDFPYQRNQPKPGCAALGFSPQGVMAFSLPFESLPTFRLIAEGEDQPFRAGIFTAEDHFRIGMIRLAEFETSRYPALCEAAWEGEVWDENGKLRVNVLQDAVEAKWYESIADLLKQFKAAGVDAVLLDVSSNPGGDDSGDMSTRLFTDVPMHSAALLMSQDRTASSAYFEEELRNLKRAASDQPDSASQKLIDQQTAYFLDGQSKLDFPCSMSWVWKERKDWNTNPCRRLIPAGSAGGPLDYLKPGETQDVRVARRLHWPAKYTRLWGTWTGPVYVLVSSRTYSSAEMFAAVLQNNHAAKIIGTRTGGDGCGFMDDAPPVTLPHSQLRFRIPNCVRLRADGSDEVAGVSPDLPVLARDGETTRERAYRVLETIQTNLKPQ